ncbi:hypothetical protein LCGC14_1249560 [marine sediment metagenome]|uniref:Uncharacterized protein n=1 Tax=marine sediment metagenome TaxID=412755 RepID=A0A0F9P7E5_9ZZZZ
MILLRVLRQLSIDLNYGWDGAQWERLTTDASGALDVNETGAALTALELIDDPVAVLGTATYLEATTSGMIIGAVRNDALATLASVDNEIAPLQVDANGSLYVTGGGGGTEYTVNVTVPADPIGTTTIMERDDIITALTEVETDWTNMRASAEGALWVQDFNSDAILTAVELIDDAIFVDDTATHSTGSTKGMGIMAVAVPTDAAIAANDIGMPAMSLDRRLHVDADITASVALDVSAATVTVDTEMATAAAATDNFANPTTGGVLGFGMLWDGATWDRMKGDATDGVLVNLGANNDVSFTASTLNGEVAVRATTAEVAVDATMNVDEADTGATTSFCVGFDASASVPIKAELQEVTDGVGTAKVTLFAQAGEPIHWRAPHRDYFETLFTANAGFDGWRVVVTNKDSSDAADLYGTIYTENS